ncbi:MAG TPA: hypothetical protein VFY19_04705 [Geminicoccaceae bacterium]|nr:hypothetical protein [Geminicoccaceae bacterium]
MVLIRLLIPLALLAGCAEPELWRAERGAVWCYRTLAAPDCHPVPLPGEEDRLIAAAPQVYFAPVIP